MILYLTNLLCDNTILSLVIVCTFIYYYTTSTYDTWRKLNVPYAKPVPIFGNIFKMFTGLEHQVDTFGRIYKQFPDNKFCGFYQMSTPFLMIRDPELINTMLVKDFSYFTDHGIDVNPLVNIMARSLFFATGQKWKIMRQKLSLGFTSSKLKGTHEQIQECSDQLIDCIREKSKITEGIEIHELVGNSATDVIGTCAFGMKLDTIYNDNSSFRKNVKKLFKPSGKVIFLQILEVLFPKIIKFLKLQTSPVDIDAINFFHSVFGEVIEYRTKNNVVRNDLTQTLMKARQDLVINSDYKGEEKYCELDIIANAMLLFSAGSETVTATASFCFYELALNKNIQDRLRAEIISSQIKYGKQFNNEFLEDLHYADMVLDETHRKYTIITALLRGATQNYKVPGESLIIEKGQKILIPIHSIHHDPKYYPNPHIFNPERFTAEEKSKRPSGTFLPFGDGLRHCIGKRFAELELKIILSKILSKFEITPCEKTEIPLKMKKERGIISPKNGIWLSFRPIVN
ncbi:probable cytochrome P450 6a13 [Melanaphis sacchari]|uniref:probable cytochrome P450 6a13 n=1 Tax=Melanaphis sacchari TaxID=742174 RepID=UPI000DC13A51|nr:probable cytochrome P450 6a13 [Melanaphis sacchari]XP_025206884.1 probable cytochrome P450 6a13 [Melanaphis sacchari]